MSSKQPTSSSSSSSLPFNKANFYVLVQEREMLKITLDFLSSENLRLKTQLEDMRITVRHNKEQLEEYVTKITNKDKIFDKMKSQIDQLTSRLKVLDNKNRKLQVKEAINDTPTVNSNIKANNVISNQTSTSANTVTHSNSLSNTTLPIPIMPLSNSKDDKNLINSKRIDDKFKEFFNRQSEIMEEMTILKDDVQFLLEYKSKSKLKEHLDQSLSLSMSMSSSSHRSSNSNVSYISNKNNDNSVSNCNSSMISNHSTNTMKRKINLKERFQLNENFNDFFVKVNTKKNLLLMVDTKGDIWELVRRKDLSVNSIKAHPEYIKSVVPCGQNDGGDKGGMIDSREYDNRSLKQSELDLSKSDFNLSRMIKESDLI